MSTIYIYQFEPPENGDEVAVIESSWCPMCGVGENHRDIKICQECKDVFDMPVTDKMVKEAAALAEFKMSRLQPIEIEVKSINKA